MLGEIDAVGHRLRRSGTSPTSIPTEIAPQGRDVVAPAAGSTAFGSTGLGEGTFSHSNWRSGPINPSVRSRRSRACRPIPTGRLSPCASDYCPALAAASFAIASLPSRSSAADRVQAARGESASYPCDHAVICAGAWSTQLLAGLSYALPLESQRGYHVVIASPTMTARPVIAADRSRVSTPMEDGLRVAGTVEFGGLAAAAEPKVRRVSGARPVSGFSARASPGRMVARGWGTVHAFLDSLPVMGPGPPSWLVVQLRSRASGADNVGNQRRLFWRVRSAASRRIWILAPLSFARFGRH